MSWFQLSPLLVRAAVATTCSTSSVTCSKDTTTEHRTHLFDLNCKICTGKLMFDMKVKSSESFVTQQIMLYWCLILPSRSEDGR